MSYRVIVHILGDDAIEGEIDELPPVNAIFLTVKNPVKRGGREVAWLDHSTAHLLISFAQLSSVEVLAGRDAFTLEKKYPEDDAHYGNRA